MLLECTKKLADTMKVDLVEYDELESNPLFDWTVTLIDREEKRGVLLMNNKTRYPIILFGLKNSDFKDFDELVLNTIKQSFIDNEFPSEVVDKYMKCMSVPNYSKTHERSILGQMSSIYKSMGLCVAEYFETSSGYSFGLSEIAGCYLYKDSKTKKIFTGVEAMKQELNCKVK